MPRQFISQVKVPGNEQAYDLKAYQSAGIYYAQVDTTSTSTAFTVTIPELTVTEYYDGLTLLLYNGHVTSASGFTINVNGLGAKPSYSNMTLGNPVTPTDPTRDTTIFNINYAMLFIYNSTRVSGGCWICYRGYDANTNTVGYQLRTNSYSLTTLDAFRYYKILFTSADNQHWVPAASSTTNSATSKKTPNSRPINPFGEIVYCGSSTNYAANAAVSATTCWQEYTLTLGYSFNTTGAALTLTTRAPVYVKCTPQANGSAIIDANIPIVQTLPSTADGSIYILLGIAYSATNIELLMNHPIYYYKEGAIRLWTNAESGLPGVSASDNGKLLTVVNGEWAPATKPSYTASEVGALPSNTTYVSSVNGQSGAVTVPDNVYLLPYGTTDATDFIDAMNAGKTVFLVNTGSDSYRVGILGNYYGTGARFYGFDESGVEVEYIAAINTSTKVATWSRYVYNIHDFTLINSDISFSDLQDIINSDRLPIYYENDYVGQLTHIDADYAQFLSIAADSSTWSINPQCTVHMVTVDSDDNWTVNDWTLQTTANLVTTVNSSSTDTKYPSAKAVYDAITTAVSGLPTPMQFKGTVGTSGTIAWSALPAASSSTGFTYKVITDHATAPICKVGDTIISNGTEWIVVPSGDEPSGTVTSVAISNGGGLSVSGSPITSSGTITISHADTSSQASVSNTGRTYIQGITLDTYGHVTGLSSATETVTDTNTTYTLNVSGTGDNATKVGLVAGGSGSGTNWYTIPYATSAGTANSVAWANISGHDAGVDADLGINTSSGDTTKFLNAKGGWTVPAGTYVHPAYNAADAAAIKVGRDAQGHVVLGTALTAADVGAVPGSGANVRSGSMSYESHDANNVTENGFYYINTSGHGPATTLGLQNGDCAMYAQSYSTLWITELAQDYRDGQIFVRSKANNVWQSWKAIPMMGASGVGSATQPVYVDTEDGTIKACTYSLNKTVPADAVFTDTTYGGDRGISLSGGNFGHSNTAVTAVTTAGLYKVKYDTYGHITGTTAVAKADITGLGIPGSDTNTTYALSGALSSHKFTSTLTAGGSGSGTSTTDLTLAAGSNITLTDDTSNRKITIAASVPIITLNGSSTTSPSFYAPTGAGTSGQYLKSNGSGAPSWTNFPTIPSITLNGSATTSPSFYAPTSAGTSGYVLQSNGSGAPSWVTPPSGLPAVTVADNDKVLAVVNGAWAPSTAGSASIIFREWVTS